MRVFLFDTQWVQCVLVLVCPIRGVFGCWVCCSGLVVRSLHLSLSLNNLEISNWDVKSQSQISAV